MTESRWRKALTEAMTCEYENCLYHAEEHVFSAKFERKMDRLAGVQKKPYYGAINSRIKRTAVIAASIAVLASALTISASANREKIADFFMRVFHNNTVFPAAEPEEAPTTIEDVYEITYDMSDYYIDYYYSNFIGIDIGYVNTDDEYNIKQIDFSQTPKIYAENTSWSTDSRTVYETIDINGFEAVYFLQPRGSHVIIWDNGDYVFSVSGWCDNKEEIIAIAESVKKKEEK
ncbi:MAG: DUF4367 domain-containing protein [Ruminiclostridium sp.]|nr:DUF4367 domain-containing protein [Ruminiclostridium sp.]